MLDHGYEVIGTSRDAQMSGFANLDKLGIRGRVRVVSMAINDSRSVFQVLNKVRPDEVYNLARLSSVARCPSSSRWKPWKASPSAPSI